VGCSPIVLTFKKIQWQEHTKCSNPSLSNSTKTTNAMGEYERKNKEEIHKELQDLDPMGSQRVYPDRIFQ
jgi:hypothetical protein